MNDSSDFNVSDNVAMFEESRMEGGRMDREHAASRRLDI